MQPLQHWLLQGGLMMQAVVPQVHMQVPYGSKVLKLRACKVSIVGVVVMVLGRYPILGTWTIH